MRYTYKHLGDRSLQDWFHVEIVKVPSSNGTVNKHVKFHSRLHKNMPVTLSFCFADIFSDFDILRDPKVVRKFIELFGAESFS